MSSNLELSFAIANSESSSLVDISSRNRLEIQITSDFPVQFPAGHDKLGTEIQIVTAAFESGRRLRCHE